jgi:hypothetical protein
LLRRRLREFVEVCYEGDTEHLLEDLLSEGQIGEEEVLRVVTEFKRNS